MRILTISNYYPPHFIGGYEIACKETMDFLMAQGHEVVVVTSDYHKNNEKENNIHREMHLVDYKNSSFIEKTKGEYDNYQIVKSAIEKVQPDLVYFWSLRGLGLSVIRAANEKNIPKVFEIGDFWMAGYTQKKSGLKQKIKSLIPVLKDQNIAISPAICVSRWVADEMKEKYSTAQTYTYPNATTIPQKHIANHSILKFIFVGRIEEEKGLDLAILALKEFAYLYPSCPFSFEVYGNGDAAYINKCKLLAKPIENMVHFKGKVDARESIYKDASVLLMPTRMREPFGLVIIEAMAHCVAVIATNAYGPAEIIEHQKNGLLFKPNSVDDLLVQIETLYFKQKTLVEFQKNGYAYVAKNYALHTVKSKIEALLQNIAKVA